MSIQTFMISTPVACAQQTTGVAVCQDAAVSRASRLIRILLFAALFVAVSALLAACDGDDPGADEAQIRRGLKAIEGIPQSGFTLGRPHAPWTLSVISAATSYELDQMITQLPAVTEEFVRPGRVKLQMRTPSADSYRGNGDARVAAAALFAAGLQGRYWDALVRFVPAYRSELETHDLALLLQRAGVADVGRAMAERSSHRVRAALARADVVAADADSPGRIVYLLTTTRGFIANVTDYANTGRLAAEIATVLASRTPSEVSP